MKAVAVAGATLSVAPATGSTGVGGVAVFTGLPSTKVRAGAAVYRGPTQITVSAVTNPAQGATTPSPPFVATLSPTAEKTRAEGQEPLREGDEVTVTVVPTKPTAPPTRVPTQMVVKIVSAGQSKVRAA